MGPTSHYTSIRRRNRRQWKLLRHWRILEQIQEEVCPTDPKPKPIPCPWLNQKKIYPLIIYHIFFSFVFLVLPYTGRFEKFEKCLTLSGMGCGPSLYYGKINLNML